jgi:hypothetical protein
MNSMVIDLIVCGLAYVISVYFIAILTKNSLKNRKGGNDEDGGIKLASPPKIDLPPGVVWPTDSPKKSLRHEPVEL